jgi:hypothetical protein
MEIDRKSPAYQKQKDALNNLFESFGVRVDDWRAVRIKHELENGKEMYLTITRIEKIREEADCER